MAERAGATAPVSRAVCLGRVLEDEQTPRLGERVDRVDVTCLPVEMDGEDRRGSRPDGGPGRGGVDQPGPIEHIAQHGRRTDVADRQRRGDERVRRHDHLVTGADAVGLQHQGQRGRAGGDAHTVLGLRVLRELSFELLDLCAKRECARVEQASKRFLQLTLDACVLYIKGDEAHVAPAPRRDCCCHIPSLPCSVRGELCQPGNEYGIGRRAHGSFSKMNIAQALYFVQGVSGAFWVVAGGPTSGH